MQSDKAPKKTPKSAKSDAAQPAESTATPEKTAKPRAARASKPKETDSSDMISGKHHHSGAPKSNSRTSKSVSETSKRDKPAAVVAESHKSVTETEIAALAYSYWAERGHGHGSHENDWLRAERELTAK